MDSSTITSTLSSSTPFPVIVGTVVTVLIISLMLCILTAVIVIKKRRPSNSGRYANYISSYVHVGWHTAI